MVSGVFSIFPQPAQTDWEFPTRCVVGDFERQSALLLGCNELEPLFPKEMIEIVAAIIERLPLVGIVDDEAQRRKVVTRLCDWGLPAHLMTFVKIPVQAMWVRDYGPQFVRRADGSVVILDAEYIQTDRPECDEAPEELASLLHVPVVKVPAWIEGGNLLSNGRGLCLTTNGLVERNAKRGLSPSDLGWILNHYYGFEQAVVLDRLSWEPTGHVDMFATFTSPDTVVVGEYDAAVDPTNALILDRNAERLAGLQTSVGPLKVERIPMPTNAGSAWRTYTNVIYGNGVLLVPVYPGDEDPAARRQAFETYARLLPGWEIRGIDATRLIHQRGALRCLSANIPWMEDRFDTPAWHGPRRWVA